MDRRRKFSTTAFIPERVNAELSRRYDIGNEVGAGGYGKVYKATDRSTGRVVAIKKVRITDDDKKQAFEKEVRIMKLMDHPNICKLLETYEQGASFIFVMEYCEGGEVFNRIGNIDEASTLEIIQQCARAIKFAHNHGIAHRDMKPENICYCTDDPDNNHVKVIDWGLGFYFGLQRMSSPVGSLTYAAPEVLESTKNVGYTNACDLWSLGVIAYVMLCGRQPFWGDYREQINRMKAEKPPMHDATWQAISENAKDFIKKLLKANPSKRMTIDATLSHPWMMTPSQKQDDPAMCRQVLSNLRQFSNTGQFFSMCVASVARQLDHRSLRDVHKVFCELDTNGDGVLSLQEVRTGFERIYGKDSSEVRDVEAMFERLDLDSSGELDYTEFCAAGIGERISTEENVLWAAFKAFDVNDDDGSITKEEIKKVLSSADVGRVWTNEVQDEVCNEIFDRFDTDGNGSIDFEEWLKLMRECAARHKEQSEVEAATNDQEKVAAPAQSIDRIQETATPLRKAETARATSGQLRGNFVRSLMDCLKYVPEAVCGKDFRK